VLTDPAAYEHRWFLLRDRSKVAIDYIAAIRWDRPILALGEGLVSRSHIRIFLPRTFSNIAAVTSVYASILPRNRDWKALVDASLFQSNVGGGRSVF
jgi:hypothetical protein